MSDKWMNLGYDSHDLKPYCEPTPDFKDERRIGEPGLAYLTAMVIFSGGHRKIHYQAMPVFQDKRGFSGQKPNTAGHLTRDVAKISKRWDYAGGRRVLWVTLKTKSSPNVFVSRESQAYRQVFYPTSDYYLHTC